MNTFLTISRQDFLTTFRDPIFKGLLLFPFVAYAIVRWALPLVVVWFPAAGSYGTVVLSWACMQAATMFGFIYGFLFLEEKEENVLDVLRIMPVSPGRLLGSRLLLGLSVSTLVNFSLLQYGGVTSLPVWQNVLLAFQFSLLAPLIALILGVFSRNRIEGLAQMKIVNIVLMLPALIYFLPSKWLHLTAAAPTYWSFRGLEAAAGGGPFWLFWSVGMVVYVVSLSGLSRLFDRRTQG